MTRETLPTPKSEDLCIKAERDLHDILCSSEPASVNDPCAMSCKPPDPRLLGSLLPSRERRRPARGRPKVRIPKARGGPRKV